MSAAAHEPCLNREFCITQLFVRLYQETSTVSQLVTIRVCCLGLRVVCSYMLILIQQLEMTMDTKKTIKKLKKELLHVLKTRECK